MHWSKRPARFSFNAGANRVSMRYASNSATPVRRPPLPATSRSCSRQRQCVAQPTRTSPRPAVGGGEASSSTSWPGRPKRHWRASNLTKSAPCAHSQLQTLSETSAHARESLRHFRNASNEQNDTLLRQEEQQAQQVEQQLRAALCQTLLWECW